MPAPGTLLGVYPDVTLTEVTFDLHHGEIMVLYTDGVTEARGSGRALRNGTAGARGRVRPAAPPTTVADRLLADVDAFQHGQQRDDIAILVVEAVPRSGRDRARPPRSSSPASWTSRPTRTRRRSWRTPSAPRRELLVVDLAGLQFVDSTGVRLILSADERARQAGRRLALRLGDGLARRVFTALGLLDRFEVLD